MPTSNNMRLQRERLEQEKRALATAGDAVASFLLQVEERRLVAWVDKGVLRAGEVLPDGSRRELPEIEPVSLGVLFEATGHVVIRP